VSEDPEPLRRTLGHMVSESVPAHLASDPAAAADLPELWLEMAEKDEAPDVVWEAMACCAAEVGTGLARAALWDHVPRAVAVFRHVPAALAARVARWRARWLRELTHAAVRDGRLREALDAADEAEGLAYAHPSPPVARAAAEALSHALRAPALAAVGGREPFLERAQGLAALAQGWPHERAIAAAWARLAPALAPVQVARGEDAAAGFALDLRAAALRRPHDLPILIALAHAAELTARAAGLKLADPARVLTEIAETLARVRGLAPDDPRVLAHAAGFEEASGMRLPDATGPAPRIEPLPDLDALDDICRNIEFGDEVRLQALLDQLAVMTEERTEGSWPRLGELADAITRRMVAAGPDTLAQAAVDFRDRYGFPHMVRL
jgi:hypothetical protein